MTGLDGARIRAAIDRAESGTTARIGVRLSDREVAQAGALDHARDEFHNARLHRHPAANAVLFLVAPKSRTFAVYGGTAIHDRLGDPFWSQLVAGMTPHFAAERPTDALIHGIDAVGEQLRSHFPKAPS